MAKVFQPVTRLAIKHYKTKKNRQEITDNRETFLGNLFQIQSAAAHSASGHKNG